MKTEQENRISELESQIDHQKNKIKDLLWSVGHLKKEGDFLFDTLVKHVNAGSIFQDGEKYGAEANLPLGSSCVIEGIKWADQKIDSLKSENTHLCRTVYDLLAEQVRLKEDNEAWKNRWDCAVTMAATAENKCDELEKKVRELTDISVARAHTADQWARSYHCSQASVSELLSNRQEIINERDELQKWYEEEKTKKEQALRLRDKWYNCYMDCRAKFHDKVDKVKKTLDDLLQEEFNNQRNQ